MANGIVTIKIGGEAGFGVKIAGMTLGRVFARMGYEVFDYSEYPSLIRGGHNTFEISVGKKIYHHTRPVSLLIALNQQTVDSHLPEVAADGGVIFDPERTQVTASGLNLTPVPISQIAKDVGGTDLMKNTVALGAAMSVLGVDLKNLLDILEESFAKKSQNIIDMNLKAATAGYEYAKKELTSVFPYALSPQAPKDQLYLTGNEAAALGAIAGGCKLCVGYPMTPATSVLEFLAKQGAKAGVLMRQVEDEISAINTAIGGGYAGVRSLVATSGGGFSLMVEAVGLSGMTESPVVIFLAQRPGPATGLPTWSEQSDLRFVMHAAQGEFPRMIIAPGDAEECFYHTAAAFNYAEKYQMPVFVLSDKNMAEGGRTVPVFDQKRIKIDRGVWMSEQEVSKTGGYKRYLLTDSGISPRVLPGTPGAEHLANSDEHDEYGFVSETLENRIKQTDKRMHKLSTLLAELPEPVLYGPKDAELTLVSWGSTKGPILQAMEALSGIPVNFLHFIYIWPFPSAQAKAILLGAKKLIVVENNSTGQFAGLISQHVGRSPEHQMLKYDGRPFFPHEITAEIRRIIAKS